MANKTATLLWYCRTEKGWRRFPAIESKNGKVKVGAVLVDGQERLYPNGRFQVRTLKGRRACYLNAGTTSSEALSARLRETNKINARLTASVAGLKIVEDPTRLSISEGAKNFVAHTTKKGKESAASTYRKALDQFLAAVDVHYVDEINKEVMLDFHAYLRSTGNCDLTVFNKDTSIKTFLRWAGIDVKKLGLITPTYEKKRPVVYTRDEVNALVASKLDLYYRTVVDVFRMTGVRKREAVYLMWPDCDFKRGLVLVRSKLDLGFRIKDNEERDLPMPPALAASLKKWRKKRPNSKFVLGTRTDNPNFKILEGLKRRVRNAGLNCGHCEGCRTKQECHHWTLHQFRRSYATRLAESGMSLPTIMVQMGHSDIETTMAYLAPMEEAQAHAMVREIKW